jgi:hypothetical protein
MGHGLLSGAGPVVCLQLSDGHRLPTQTLGPWSAGCHQEGMDTGGTA